MDSHPTSCFKAPSPIAWPPTESSPQRQLRLPFDSLHHSHHYRPTHTSERADSQADGAAERVDAHEKRFKCRRADLPGERGQLLNTQPEPWRSGSYGVLCICDTAWLLPCRHHIRPERPNWCVYSPQQDQLPLQHQIMDVSPSCQAAWNKRCLWRAYVRKFT